MVPLPAGSFRHAGLPQARDVIPGAAVLAHARQDLLRNRSAFPLVHGQTLGQAVIVPCTAHVPVPAVPAQVTVVRGGKPLNSPPTYLQVGDDIRVRRPHAFTFAY